MAKLTPWYKVVTPREDLRDGRPLDASEFAVHLDHIRDRKAHADYVEPARFFERTFLTRSLLDLASQVVRRLSGIKVETSAVFNMATQFGGGKTHSLTALYHLANGGPAADRWRGVVQILSRAQVPSVPKAAVAVFVGDKFDAINGRGGTGTGEPQRRTPWGEIAWQLGGEKSFAAVARHDADGIAPGGDVLEKMLPDGPALILMDELMNYVSRARKSGLGAQTHLFLQNLTGVAAAADRLVLCVSIPSSSETELPDPEDRTDYEAFKKMLDRVGKAVSMSNEGEITEIIRRRLFEWSGITEDAKKTIAAYAEWARDHAAELANVSAETVLDDFKAAYPFHPSVISVFTRKWQSLPRFQRTRGVLRLLALWVSRAYSEGYGRASGEPLIQLGSAPLHDPTFCDAVFEQLGEDKLRVPVTTDITGKADSHAVRLDNEANESIRKGRLHQKVATVIFFESNGGQSQAKAEATAPEIKTALGGPDFNLAEVETALEGLASTCFYLVWDRNRYRFGLRPNLNQMLVTWRGNVKEKDIRARIREETEALFRDGAKGLDRKFFPERSNDVPDRPQLTLVVMGMDTPATDPPTAQLVEEIIRSSGTTGRTFKSGLIFAVPHASASVQQAAQTLLAWEDIDADEEAKSRLDEAQRRLLDTNLKRAARDLKEAIFRSYRYAFLLGKDNKLKEQDFGKNTSGSIERGRIADLYVQELRRVDELVDGVGPSKLIRYWPPAMTDWSTKDVRDAFFASPALPRLLNPTSIARTIADGVSSGILGYGRRRPNGGLTLLRRPGESLAESDVEISDEVCILKPKDAQKLLEPPRLARIVVHPDRVELRPGEHAVFTATGFDQYNGACALEGMEWKAVGGEIDAAGRFTAGAEPGAYSVAAEKDGVVGRAAVQILSKTAPAAGAGGAGGGGGSGRPLIRWTGTVPPQRWTNFYTKVLTRFANTPGLKITVSFEVPVDADKAKASVDDARSALRELGLGDSGLEV